MSRQGRELELLIEKLEKSVLPEGSSIQSPGMINDRITGQPREVDILIDYKIGTVPIRIIIECRDRKAKQDTQWIEQIKTKVNDLQVNKVIAVSSSTFTKPAIDKAKFYGIETRTYKEIDLSVINSWWKIDHLVLLKNEFKIISAKVELEESNGFIEYSKDKKVNDKFISQTSDKNLYSFNDLFSSLLDRVIKLHNLIPNGPSVRTNVKANCSDKEDRFFLKLNQNKIYIKSIKFTVDLFIIAEKIPISRISSYESKDESFSQVIEFDGVPIGDEQILQIIKNSDGSLSVSTRKAK